MERVEERAQELRKLNISQKKAIEILKENYPDYDENYYNELTKDWSNKEVKNITSQRKKALKKVKVTGFDMPFIDMVVFMVKWAFASIPAFIIIFIIIFIIRLFFTSLGITILL